MRDRFVHFVAVSRQVLYAKARRFFMAAERFLGERMVQRPLVSLTVGFMAGLLLSERLWIPRLLLGVAAGGALTLMMLSRRRRMVFGMSIIFAGLVLGLLKMNAATVLSERHIDRLVGSRAEIMRIRGVVSSDPQIKKNKTIFTLTRLQSWEPEQVPRIDGAMLVHSYLPVSPAQGDIIEFVGRVGRPTDIRLGERLQYRSYLRQRGIYAQAWIGKRGSIRRLGQSRGGRIMRSLSRIRARAREALHQYLSPVSADILSAMLLGARGDVPRFVNVALQRSGTVHMLAVSGLHVGIIAAVLFGLLRYAPLDYRARHGVALLCLVAYCIFTGCRVSIVRATLMAATALFAPLVGRDYDGLSALALAALCILWGNPLQMADIGFSLSFSTVLCILCAAPVLCRWIPSRLKKYSRLAIGAQAAVVSLAAWLGSAGLVAYYFGIITPVAVVANMLLIPLLFLIVVSGMVLLLCSAAIPFIAPGAALCVELLIGVLYRVNGRLIALPGAYGEGFYPEAHLVVWYYIGLLALGSAIALISARVAKTSDFLPIGRV